MPWVRFAKLASASGPTRAGVIVTEPSIVERASAHRGAHPAVVSLRSATVMAALALKTLDSLRSLFIAESARGLAPVHTVLVIYPEYDFAWGVRKPDGTERQPNATPHPIAPWPPPHAIRLGGLSLAESAGCLSLERGVWRCGWYGADKSVFAHLRELTRDAGTAYGEVLRLRADLAERMWMSRAKCLFSPSDLWITALHQLGWEPMPGSPLRWERFTWDDRGCWPLSKKRPRRRGRRALRSRRVMARQASKSLPLGPAVVEPKSHPGPQPSAWHYSIAGPDLFRASAFAIDAILSLVENAPVSGTADAHRGGQKSDSGGPGTESALGRGESVGRREKYWWISPLLVVMGQHPEWSIAKMAEKVGVKPQTIYRAAEKQEIVRKLVAAKRAPERHVRKGYRDADSGRIEAIDSTG